MGMALVGAVGTGGTGSASAPLVNQLGRLAFTNWATQTSSQQQQQQQPLRLRQLIDELDVYAALDTAHALICAVASKKEEEHEWENVSVNSVNVNDNDTPADADADAEDVLSVCVRNLRAAVTTLRKDLHAAESALRKHDEKWMGRWRNFDATPHVHALTVHKRQFDARFKTLLDVVSAGVGVVGVNGGGARCGHAQKKAVQVKNEH